MIDNKKHLDLLVTDDEGFQHVPVEYRKNLITLSKKEIKRVGKMKMMKK